MSSPPRPIIGERAVLAAPGPHDAPGEQGGSGIPGFSGPTRVRLPLFALVALGTVLIGVIPFPSGTRVEIIVALVLFFLLVTAAFVLPWERFPSGAWLVIPIGYMAVIALIRDAQGGGDSELVIVYLLPIVWVALYGKRAHLLVALFCMDLALMVPVLLLGAPEYPLSTWRQIIILIVVTTLVASTISTMVHRGRLYARDLARQSRLAKRNADDADNARDRLETLLRAATGSAIMGVDPAGTVTFFSAGAELMLGYSASEVVGIRSIADFIDPAQIDERRQTIDAMRKTLDQVDPETMAEVPWTARRKNGEQRRCVVRVRTLPAAGSSDAPGGYVVVAIDVTEREELAAERERLYSVQREVTQSLIEQNNRLRELTQMKDDVVATVSHELRTPITSIRGFVELLLDGVPELSEDQMRMLRTIDRNSAQLQRVAEDLLADPGGGHGLRVVLQRARPAPVGRGVGARRPDGRHHRRRHGLLEARPLRARVRRLDPAAPAAGEPAVQRHQVLAPGRAGQRGRRRSSMTSPGFSCRTRGPASPKPTARNSSSASTAWRRRWRWGFPAPASGWPSPSRWPRPTMASSTLSTPRAGRPPSASSCPCAARPTRR